MSKTITRFAPSPSGYLHLGHGASAGAAFGFAQERGGVCLLRIEDIDSVRCKPEYETAIYEDSKWLGFTWPEPVRRQSDHFSDYDKTLQRLRGKKLVYRCFKTRKEILADITRAPHYNGELYKGPLVPLSADEETALVQSGKPYAWRLSLKACELYLHKKNNGQYNRLEFSNNGAMVRAMPALLGDVILARKDVGTSYHLACCHDDALQGVTDIVRGVDLLESTHIHRLLQEILDWSVPNYHHHELLTDENGKRYAKRDKAMTLRQMRAQGADPKNILEQSKVFR